MYGSPRINDEYSALARERDFDKKKFDPIKAKTPESNYQPNLQQPVQYTQTMKLHWENTLAFETKRTI